MNLNLPGYIRRYKLVMAITVPLLAIIFNLINFSSTYFSSAGHFTTFTFISIIGFAAYFIASRAIAAFFKKRIPAEQQLYFRLSIVILIFLVVTALFSYAMLHLYELFPWLNYQFTQNNFIWSFILIGLINIFLIFLMEGIDHYTNWKENYKETEKLTTAYKQSQLNGLKSQVNPHFLFNSLNSLSSLIQEDEEKAETFLNEMSKVYRYMLRNDEEQLVTVDTELKFLSSYMHLLKARYGDGLKLHFNINEESREKMLAPLTLQVLLENAFTQNIVSKSAPLIVNIYSGTDNNIIIKNNLQLKKVSGAIDFEAGLDNLIKKYELLNKAITVNESNKEHRTIIIPLLEKTEEVSL
jgi:two-component system, LytTR family, sensor kinase